MKKILSLLVVISSMQLITHGFDITFDSFSQGDPIKDKFSVVHFTLPNVGVNDFQGGFFWLPTKQLIPAQSIKFTDDSGHLNTRACSKQLRGLYYTNAKGSRLWPLDTQSLNGLALLDSSYSGLDIKGGFYTTCAGGSAGNDTGSIYGHIIFTQTAGGVPIYSGTLSAGFMYDPANNEVDTTKGFFPTFQYFNNQTPIGYIYDNVGGIGFVGGVLAPEVHDGLLALINSGSSINNIFSFTQAGVQTIQANIPSLPGGHFVLEGGVSAGMDTLWNISVLGNVLLSRGGLDMGDRQSVLGNPNISSSIVFSDVINTSDILNILRKNADAACRGQQKITQGGTVGTLVTGSPRTVCVYNDNGTDVFDVGANSDVPLVIDLSKPSEYDGIEFVVKGRNVVLQGSVPSKSDSINLFVDNGNVLLKNGTFDTEVVHGSTTNTNYTVFDAKGGMVNSYEDVKPIFDRKVADLSIAGTNIGGYNDSPISTWSDTHPNNPQVGASAVYSSLQSLAQRAGTTASGGDIVGTVNYGVYLRGNIFVNGLIAGRAAGDKPSGIVNKYYIHGRLASLNTALAPSQKRVDLINTIFHNDSSSYINDVNLISFINFTNVFSWQCLLNGYAADADGVQTQQPCKVTNDAFKFNPLILINSGVPSKLLP